MPTTLYKPSQKVIKFNEGPTARASK